MRKYIYNLAKKKSKPNISYNLSKNELDLAKTKLN